MSTLHTLTVTRTLSNSATLYCAQGYIVARAVSVVMYTDDDGDSYLRVGRTLHALSDVVDADTETSVTPDTTSVYLLASNQTLSL